MPVGDPNGIGPEIALKSAISADVLKVVKPVIVADPTVIEATAGRLGLEDRLSALLAAGSVALSPVEALTGAPTGALTPGVLTPGAVTAEAGAAAVAYARAAIRLVESRGAQAVVAGPHNETAIARAGIPFAGYPQLLAETTGTDPEDVFLMLVGPRFRFVHATLHVGLRQALDSLTTEKVLSALRAAHGALRRIGIERPRIAVCGINPHAGEGGLFGNEDAEITAPAVARANAEGIAADGPRGADLLLQECEHDAYIAMYHDQGHIPIKLEGRGNAFGISIGAPVLFGTVAHGSAHDIAGTGRADPAAFAVALTGMARLLEGPGIADGTAPAGG